MRRVKTAYEILPSDLTIIIERIKKLNEARNKPIRKTSNRNG